jgi:aspartate aminotransferase
VVVLDAGEPAPPHPIPFKTEIAAKQMPKPRQTNFNIEMACIIGGSGCTVGARGLSPGVILIVFVSHPRRRAISGKWYRSTEMPPISRRAGEMPSSPIRRLVGFAIAAERRGTKVHYLNIGQPDVESPPEFWQAVAHAGLKTLEYSHSAGMSPLKEAMAADYRSKGISVDPADVMVTTGGSEATLFAFLTCFDPGDEVIVVEPFYANYLGFANMAGVELVAITTRIEEDFALPSADEIAARLTPKTKGILLCNPSNPTGTVYSPETLRKVAQMARERDLFLLVDEVYRDFYYGSEQLLSVLQIEDLAENAVMIDSVSKKFSLCGARVGFLVSRNTAVLAGALKLGQARLCSPTLDQVGVTACLEQVPPSYFSRVRAEYMSRRDLLSAELAKMPGVLCPRIDGAFYAVVQLPVDDSDRFCEWLVSEFSHNGETVLLAPASGFYATPGNGRREVRIAYVLDKVRLKAAMDCLAAGLEAYQALGKPRDASKTASS